jgi:hypothetical protein
LILANFRNLSPSPRSLAAGNLNGNSRKQISYVNPEAKPGLPHVPGKVNLHPLKRQAMRFVSLIEIVVSEEVESKLFK